MRDRQRRRSRFRIRCSGTRELRNLGLTGSCRIRPGFRNPREVRSLGNPVPNRTSSFLAWRLRLSGRLFGRGRVGLPLELRDENFRLATRACPALSTGGIRNTNRRRAIGTVELNRHRLFGRGFSISVKGWRLEAGGNLRLPTSNLRLPTFSTCAHVKRKESISTVTPRLRSR